MENTLKLTAEQYSGLLDPEALYSENQSYRMAARMIQNGHPSSVDDRDLGDFHSITTTYSDGEDVWSVEVTYPVYRQGDVGDACRPEHSIFRNVYIDTPLSVLFIGNRLTFRNCVFAEGIKLTETQEFDASYCVVLGDASILGDKVINRMSFEECIFCRRFVMKSCVMSTDLDFLRCTFLSEFTMSVNNIGGDANFSGNKFGRIFSLTQSSLNGMFLFGSNLCDIFLMNRCVMNSGSDISGSDFSEQFMLINSRMNADTTFDNITFPYADLSSNYFSTLTLSNCRCGDTISFIDSRFENDAVLVRVYSPKIDFIRTKITAMLKVDGVQERYGTHNRSPGEISEICVDILDFRDATVMGELVLKNCYKAVDFRETRISGGLDIDWDYLNVLEGRFVKRFRRDCRIRNADSDTMMTLYEAMTGNKKYADAEKYFQAYNLIKRFEPRSDGRVPKYPVLSYLHELISGFGRSPKRLFVFVVFLILVFGVIYWGLGLGPILESIYFSGITFFTIGFTEVGVMNMAVKLMAVAEGFSGVFSMSYLVSSLTRRNI